MYSIRHDEEDGKELRTPEVFEERLREVVPEISVGALLERGAMGSAGFS